MTQVGLRSYRTYNHGYRHADGLSLQAITLYGVCRRGDASSSEKVRVIIGATVSCNKASDSVASGGVDSSRLRASAHGWQLGAESVHWRGVAIVGDMPS
jgi:hypothetical protein